VGVLLVLEEVCILFHWFYKTWRIFESVEFMRRPSWRSCSAHALTHVSTHVLSKVESSGVARPSSGSDSGGFWKPYLIRGAVMYDCGYGCEAIPEFPVVTSNTHEWQ